MEMENSMSDFLNSIVKESGNEYANIVSEGIEGIVTGKHKSK